MGKSRVFTYGELNSTINNCKRIFIMLFNPSVNIVNIACLLKINNAFDKKNFFIFWFLLVLSQSFYIFALIKLVGLLKLKFYPSYSGFTFPLVISALALKLSNGFLINQGVKIAVLPILIKVEEIIAVIIVFYVLIIYLENLVKNKAI